MMIVHDDIYSGVDANRMTPLDLIWTGPSWTWAVKGGCGMV